MAFSFLSACGNGCCTKITNSGYEKYEYEFSECMSQKKICPQVSRPTITCNLKLQMKLKTLKSEIRSKINSHMK
jgi:hypothetical protein